MNSPTEKRILVTGGCGFIGSNFVRYLYTHHPHDVVINLDALTYAGNLENVADIEATEREKLSDARRYLFFKGDIADVDTVRSIFRAHKIDYIVHFAAESHVDRSYFNVSDFLRTNVDGTRVLAEVAQELSPDALFVHISTDEIYGSVKEGTANEEASIRPSNLYAASKAAADILLQAYIKTAKLKAVIVRGSNNYGPYQYPEKLIPLAITNLMGDIRVPLHGSGMHVRSWLHVFDFCQAIDVIMRQASPGDVFNVSGEEKTNLAVLEEIAAVLGTSLNERLSRVADRPGADMRYAPDSSKIRTTFGWAPKHSFSSELPVIIEWYRTHRQWWESIKAKKEFIDHYEKQSKAAWY